MILLLVACKPPGGDLVMTDEHNYSYSGSMDVSASEVATGGDVLVRWDGLSTDMRGREIVEIEQAALIAFNLEQDQVLTAIANNDLLQSDIHDFRTFNNAGGATQARLSEFSILGNTFDPEDDFVEREGTWTWSVSLINLDEGKRDFLSLMFLVPSDTETLEAAFDDATAQLDFTADLHTATALRTSVDQVYTVDWSALSTDGLDHGFDLDLADRLMIGRMDVENVTGVEERFLDLLGQAAEYFRLDVTGQTSATLAEATSPEGEAFGGFTTEGVWLVGLECTICTSPAPIALAIVEVVD